METLLVTGHSGFIGRNLVNQLSSKYKIIGFAKKNLHISKISEIKGDIRKINSKQIPRNISSVIHMAAVADVEYCENNPSKCIEINFIGTKQALELARKKDSKFVFLSTAHVFGTPTKIPINEKHPKKPHSVYAISKLCGEVLCEAFSKTYGMAVSIVRLFSVYGPYSPKYLVTAKMICQLIEKNRISLGNTSSKRDFLHVYDAISAIELIFKKTGGFNSYNVGSGKSHSIKELCGIIQKISQKKVQITTNKNWRKNDVKEVVANNSKIKNLGWKSEIGLEKGLKLTYNWFNYNKKFCK